MATSTAPVAITPTTSDDGSGTMKVVIISLALLAVGGLGFYFYTTKKVAKPAGKGGASKGVSSSTTSSSSQSSSSSSDEAVDENGDTAEQRAYDAAHYGTQATSSGGVSPVRTDFDGEYNYQKKSGTWWTAKKSAPSNWFSLADPKWASAVAKLNAKYPND